MPFDPTYAEELRRQKEEEERRRREAEAQRQEQLRIRQQEEEARRQQEQRQREAEDQRAREEAERAAAEQSRQAEERQAAAQKAEEERRQQLEKQRLDMLHEKEMKYLEYKSRTQQEQRYNRERSEWEQYQQNLANVKDTFQANPTERGLYALALDLYRQDEEKGRTALGMISQLQADPTSPLYNPYAQPSNQAVGRLQALGIDCSNIDNEWIEKNSYLMQYWTYNEGTNTPKKPGKKATKEEQQAYEYYQVLLAQNNTNKALEEQAALKHELEYWANAKDRNYSDEEILDKIDWSKYSTLSSMRDQMATRKGTPMELNTAVNGWSNDWAYGVLWAARNNGGTGNNIGDMVASVIGKGNQWKQNNEISQKLNPGNKETYSPYSVGSTMEKERLYFGVDSFDQKWIDDNWEKYMGGNDETAKKMFINVIEANKYTDTLDEQLGKMNSRVDYLLTRFKNPEKILNLLKNDDTYSALFELDDSLDYGDTRLKNTTRAVDYRWKDIEDKVRQKCYQNNARSLVETVVSGITAVTDQTRAALQMIQQEAQNFFGTPAMNNEQTQEEDQEEDQGKGQQPDQNNNPVQREEEQTPVETEQPEPIPGPEPVSNTPGPKRKQQKGTNRPAPESSEPIPASIPAPTPTPIPTAVMTESEREQEEYGRNAMEDLTTTIEEKGTDAEKAALTSGKTTWFDRAVEIVQNAQGNFLRSNREQATQGIVNNYFGQSRTIHEYNSLQQRLQNMQQELEAINQERQELQDRKSTTESIGNLTREQYESLSTYFNMPEGQDFDWDWARQTLSEDPNNEDALKELFWRVTGTSIDDAGGYEDQVSALEKAKLWYKYMAQPQMSPIDQIVEEANWSAEEESEPEDDLEIEQNGMILHLHLNDQGQYEYMGAYDQESGAFYNTDLKSDVEKRMGYKPMEFLTDDEEFRLGLLEQRSSELEQQIEDGKDNLGVMEGDYRAASIQQNMQKMRYMISGILENTAGGNADSSLLNAMDNIFAVSQDYVPTNWTPYSVYEMGIANGEYSLDDAYAQAKRDCFSYSNAAKELESQLVTLDQNGVQMSNEERKNVQRYIDALKRDAKSAMYYMLGQEEDFDSVVEGIREKAESGELGEKAKMIATKSTSLDLLRGMFDVTYKDELARMDEILKNMSDDEQNRFLYLLGKDGEQAAMDYFNVLTDPDYGVITVRKSENRVKEMQEFASQNGLTALAATGLSLLSNVMAGPRALFYELGQKLTGGDVSYHNDAFMYQDATSALRGGAKEWINSVTGNNPFFDMLYEAATSSADSMINAALTNAAFDAVGTILGGTKLAQLFGKIGAAVEQGAENGGIVAKAGNFLIKVGGDMAHAANMGLNAASAAYRKAILNGTPDQAEAMFTATFFAETASEGVTFSNLHEAFAAGSSEAKNFVIEFFKNAGEEFLGEAANEYIEQNADRLIMGSLSEYDQTVQYYLDQQYPESMAKELAEQAMWKSVLLSGAVGALSSGIGSATSYVAGKVSNRNERNAAVNNQQTAMPAAEETQSQERRAKDLPVNNQNKQQTPTEETTAPERRAKDIPVNNQNQQEATAEETTAPERRAKDIPVNNQNQTTTTQETTPTQERPARDIPVNNQRESTQEQIPTQQELNQLGKDMQTLTGADGAQPESTAVSITSVLNTGNQAADKAAGQTIVSVMANGDTSLAAEAIQQMLMTNWGTQPTTKMAIQQASLTNGAGHQALQNIFNRVQNGQQITAEHVDAVVAGLIQDRRSDPEGFDRSLQNAVTENRTANAALQIASTDEYRKNILTAETALDDARTQLANAQQASEEANNHVDAIAENLRAAEQEYDPSNEETAAPLEQITNKILGAKTAAEQQEAAVEKQQQNVEAKAKALSDIQDDVMFKARQEANAVIEEQNRQAEERKAREAELKAQQEEDARLKAEEAAKVQAEVDEKTGKAWEDKRDELVEKLLDEEYLEEGERREKRREELTERADMIKAGKIDMAGMMNNTEGLLAVGIVGRRLGVDVQMTSDPVILPKGAAGKYENGTVYLNANMIQQGKMTVGQAVMEVAMHEFTHAMEGTKQYGKYSQTVLDFLFQGDEARLAAAVDSKIEEYKEKFGQDLTPEKAKAEIVADFAKHRLNDREIVQRFVDNGIASRIRNSLHNINQAIKNFRLTGVERETAEYLRKTERLYQKMIERAARSSVHPDGGQFSIAQLADSIGLEFNQNTLEMRTPDGQLIDGVNNKITPEMLTNTPIGMLIGLAENGMTNKKGKSVLQSTITKETADAQRKMFADLANMAAQYKDSNLVWEIASSTLFSAMKSNSDPQYSTTVDFGTICAKTQEIINVMSSVMLEKGRGLTREEVLDVYNETAKAGLTVPCPVCYVFSRWMGVPSLLGQMSQYQKRFVKTNKDNSIDVAATQKAANEYIKSALEKYGSKEGIDDAKTSIQNRLKTQEKNRTDALKVLNSETATEKEKAAAKAKHDKAIKMMDSLTADLGEVEAFNWVTQALCKQERKGKKVFNVLDADGNYVVDSDFALTPDDVLFDLRRTGEFAKFTKNWSYRNTRGAGMGKAIMPYSGESIGDIIYGTNRKMASANPFLTQDPQTAAKGIKDAIARAVQQNLIGGQRLQSTSDFRPEWGLDYMTSFLELQAIGSKVQMYTKVAEAVPLLASMGADINLSIMGKGKGWHVDDNGNYVLDFSDVTGMKYETAKGLKDKYSNVQMILVGMNDTHIRLALADSDIDFVIPWHSSGNSKDTLASLVSSASTGHEQLETSSDYTDTQSDKASENQTEDQAKLWGLRMKILQGKKINAEERNIIYHDDYLKPLYDRFNVEGKDADCYRVKLAKDQAKQIFPYEYWNKSLTKDQADENGKAFVEYCQHFGIIPRFSGTVRHNEDGTFDVTGNFAGAVYDDEGNITGYDPEKMDKGYWKVLIDRPMYDNDGNYRDQQVVDVTKAKIGSLENGKLTDSDIPLTTSAMYGPEYSEQEKNAVDNALAAINEQEDLRSAQRSGQFSDGGASLTQLDQEYDEAVRGGDMEAAQEDVDFYAEQKGYTDECYHGTEFFGFTEFDLNRGDGTVFVAYTPGISQTYAYDADVKEIGKKTDIGNMTHAEIADQLNMQNNATYRGEKVVGCRALSQEEMKTRLNDILENGGEIRDLDMYQAFAYNEYYSGGVFELELGNGETAIVAPFMATTLLEKSMGQGLYRLYSKPGKQLVIDTDSAVWNNIPWSLVAEADPEAQGVYPDTEGQNTRTIAEWAKEHGYDSVRINNIYDYGGRGTESKAYGDIGIFFSQDDVKSADPVTYDDQGNVIPLSQRFSSENPDIRYSDGGVSLTDIEKILDNVKGRELTEEEQIEFAKAKAEAYSSDFADKYEKWDKKTRGIRFVVGKTPHELVNLNIPDHDVAITSDNILHIWNWHFEMNDDLIKQLPTIVNNPVLGVQPKKHPDRVVLFGEVEANNAPVLVALETVPTFDKFNQTTTLDIVNAYAKDNDPSGYISSGKILFYDKRRIGDWSRGLRLQLPSTLVNTDSSDETLSQDQNDVNGSFSDGGTSLTNLDQTLVDSGIIAQEDLDTYNRVPSVPSNLPGNAIPEEGGSAQRQFGRVGGTASTSDALHQEVKDYLYTHSSYTPDSNQAQIDRAISWVQSQANQDDPDGYRSAVNEVTSSSFDYRSADGQARMLTVMGMAVLRGDTATELQIADAYNKQGTDLGRQLQARKIFRLMTPIGRRTTLQQQVSQINENYGRMGSNNRVALSEWTLRAAEAAETEEDFQKVQKAAAKELAEQMPANWKEKLTGWRMLSMLGNPRTHIRNIVGNALFVPAVSIKNKAGALMEMATRQENRTKTLSPVVSKDIRNFAKADAVTMKDTLTGDAKYNEDNAVDRERKAFNGILQSIIDFNSDMLEKEDWVFLKGHYKRALGGWMQANGYTVEQMQNNPSLLETGREYAIQEAQKATYRDFNGLAQRLNQMSRNPQTTGQKVLAFGVDAVLPFKKTPANIMKRGLEYSPVGIAKSLTTDLFHLKQYNDYQNGKLEVLPDKAITPNQFIDHLCSGLTGTAIMAVGALLGHAGIISCGLGDDDDRIEKEKGNQEYSVKFSILGQDYTFTIDWAAPMSMPFFVGAAVQEQLADQEGFDIEELVNAFGNISEPVFNLSMLDGVNSLLKITQNSDDANTTLTQIGAKVASNYATSYVPSLMGAIARTIDDTRRKSYVESGKGTGVLGTFRYALEQTENKIPGLSQTNIPIRDVFGNPDTSSLAERVLENFILPGYVNQYNTDPVLNEIGKVYDDTGDASLVPKDPSKSFSYKNQKYVLTAEEWDAYKKERGQTAYNMLKELMQTDEYQNADSDLKASMIGKVWDYADKVGKKAAVPSYEVTNMTVENIANTAVSDDYNSIMLKALDSGDTEAYDVAVEALHQHGVEDKQIKEKIANIYRDQYKEAYLKDDVVRMAELEELLDSTGFSFDYDNWKKQADK